MIPESDKKFYNTEIALTKLEEILTKKLTSEYVKKLDKIEREEKRIHFRNIEEFDKHFGL